MSEIKFEFTDQEFLELLNAIIGADTAPGEEFVKLTSMDQSIGEDQMDSLGTVVFFAWIDQIFQIPTDKIEQFSKGRVYTITAIKDFIMANCSRSYTYKQAREFIKECS